MPYAQEFVEIDKNELLPRLLRMKTAGWMLTQISVTAKTEFDILYSLERNYDLISLRVILRAGEALESVSAIYSYAYLYENEMKDLFGLDIRNMNVDFKGNLYQTAIKTPFGLAPELEVRTVEEAAK